MRLVLLLVFSLFISGGRACVSNTQCPHCFACDVNDSVCVQVEAYTDPLGHCGTHCETAMVCGVEPYCVHVTPPTCACDWLSGICQRATTAHMTVQNELSKTEASQDVVIVPPDLDKFVHQFVTMVIFLLVIMLGREYFILKARVEAVKGDLEDQKVR